MKQEVVKNDPNEPKLLSIKQVSDIFGVHPDTLRNWEKDGILVPLRVGKRQDRRYRPEDIEAITAKMGSKLTLQQLEQFLWKSADILRAAGIDSENYKKYIFGLLFYKRISDVWDEEYNEVMTEFKDPALAKADYNHRFQVPKDCRWSVVAEQAESIGKKLNEIFDKLTNANSPKLDKIFDDLDFANKDKFPNEVLQKLVNHFSQYNFGSNYISSDLLGDAYEYLIEQFAADAGKKGGEFYSPREIERVIINILKPHEKDHIYDPCVGSAGFLLESFNYLKDKAGEKIAKTLYLYGQEINLGTYAIAKINMFLHGLDSADIRRGDTLSSPQFLDDFGALKKFDICVTNFPYSIKQWAHQSFATNKYGRVEGYDMPPTSNADYAFILHIIKSLNSNGRAGVIAPHGVLFRGGSEGRIRELIIKNDLIDAIIAMPSKLFYTVGIPVCIVIFSKHKPAHKKNKILFINAENEYQENKKQNILRKQNIEKIVKAYDDYQDVEKFARVIDAKEIEENEFNLNVRRYIDNAAEEEVINVSEVWGELTKLEKEREKIDKKVEGYLKGLKY
jgi:type I restriction enzyme M protein